MTESKKVATLYTTFALLIAIGVALIDGPASFFIIELPAVYGAVPPTNGHAARSRIPRTIASLQDWNAAISRGRCVLFLDCDWNYEVSGFRKHFTKFAERASLTAAVVKIDSERQDELFWTIQHLLETNSLSQWGLKNFGGAGRIIWLDQGRVVDSAWCVEVNSPEQLRSRTDTAFRSFTAGLFPLR